ncbi:MAG TPA: hypothetical protein DD444_10690 [Citreicella sp.]|uniref:Uncharacterized protein n=1 Tax=Salipiger marinus TaxID=555512 RepID=A0A1G8UF61_9RHOB|nr:hypothetical protein [Salipiger marinus]SDJ52433.1 hypothetical protein SAMN04487993_104030 [Salipiger marinus]HBM59647.1 hypothetical protein [Citreicella sp.]
MATLNPGAWKRVTPSLGLTRAELDAFVDQAREDGFIPKEQTFLSKQGCINALRLAREAAYAAHHAAEAARRRPVSQPRRNGALCEIPAAEVNAWLASLPPERLDP